MPPLIFARLSGRVYEVRYRGTAQPDRAFQDFPQRAAQAFRLTMRELRAMPRRVNLCPPQAFIRIDVSYSAQNVLIEQQSLDPRAPRADPLRELLFGHIEWIGAKRPQLFPQRSFLEEGHPAEAPRIRVAQLASIIEREARMRVFFAG